MVDELGLAVRDGDVGRDRSHPGRWIAYGVWLAVVVEISIGADDAVVVTVFEARLG